MKNFKIFALALPLIAGSAAASAPSYDSAAPIAYMIDQSSGRILYARDADRRMPPASMAKMMTVYVAFKLIKEGRLKLDQTFTVRPETWRRWHGAAAGSLMFLDVDSNVSVDNLLKGIVTLSGNDACVVLAEGIAGTEASFTDLMNAEGKRLGLTNSHFGTSNGWPDNGVTYVTARDLANLAAATIRDFPDLYKQYYSLPSFTWGKQIGNDEAITQANRDPLLGRIDGADGLKTGHTDEALYGFTGSASQNGRRLIMVVAGLPTFNSRIEESVRFMDWGFKAWRGQPLYKAGAKVATAQVQGGWTRQIDLVAPSNLAATIPNNIATQVKAKVVYDGPLKAPIAKGQTVAHLVVDAGDGTPQSLPLAASEAVSEGGFFARLWTGFLSFFG
jgi:D-alanyl-D-alanine carboxypeptidase (penicillin-binding protein 5/6)